MSEVIRFRPRRPLGLAPAMERGRLAFDRGYCVAYSNPYRPGTDNHARFIEGYERARRQWLGAA